MDARQHLESLVGTTIYTLGRNRPNKVLRIEGDNVIVGTKRSPHGEPVPIELIQAAIDRLERDGEVEISVEAVGHRSAFVGAVLGTLPDVDAEIRPGYVVRKDGK